MNSETRDLITRLANELEQLGNTWCWCPTGPDTCTNDDCVRRRRLIATARLAAPVFVCGGRALDDQTQPVGEPCGRTFNPRRVDGDAAVIAGMARAAGWKLGPPRRDTGLRDAICPQCARPDKTVAKLCDDLTASIGGVDG